MGKIEKLFFVDVETMGTDDESDQIIEIGAAVCTLLPNQLARIDDMFHALIKPMHERMHGYLPVGVTSHQTKLVWPAPGTERYRVAPKVPVDVEWDLPEFHHKGFASANWGLAIPLNIALDSFLMFWRKNNTAAWIGQNPDFDLRFLRRDARRCGFRWPTHPEVDYHTFDTASRMLPLTLRNELPGVGLKHSRAWAGVPGEQSHRAMGDVQDEIAVWNALALYDHGIPPSYVHQHELDGDGWRDVTNHVFQSKEAGGFDIMPGFLPGSEDMG